MTAYVVIELDVLNAKGFQEYIGGVGPLIEQMGGHTLVSDADVTVLEGEWTPASLVIHAFSTKEDVQRFWDSAAYEPLKLLRRKHSTVKVVVAGDE